MTTSTFKTNPVLLHELLDKCHRGLMQLPDFQRGWVWDEERIKSLIASISRAFPIGALMELETGGPVSFKPRPIEGAPHKASEATPYSLLLDGQQRMTSLYQVAMRGQVVDTITPKGKKVKRWFYVDIRKAMDPTCDREDAVIAVPEDKVIRTEFGRQIVLDLSTVQKEAQNLMFPLSNAFEWDAWQDDFNDCWAGDSTKTQRDEFKAFKKAVLEVFRTYQVPVISLDRETSREAVCVVFEKVNTGGKALDAFELVTAIYATTGHELRKDWYGDKIYRGRHTRFQETLRPPGEDKGILDSVSNTDFLQAVSLFHTREVRQAAEATGRQGKELPAVSGNRNALLNLPLGAYKKYEAMVEEGFVKAAKFLNLLRVNRTFDLPYQSQLIPLAAVLADIGDAWEHEAHRAKLFRWYWSGVFGELYGSAIDSRISRDFMEVPSWLRGGTEPTTVSETIFRPDRLKTMRMRLSAAYKGMNALLMEDGAMDFRSGQSFSQAVFFGEAVDIHHIFPKDWCERKGISATVYDSIINKTPLSYKTNRIIGGVAPSEYLAKLEAGNSATPPIAPGNLDRYLLSHHIDPALLRADDFDRFMEDRKVRLLRLIEHAMGKPTYRGDATLDEEFAEDDEDTAEALHTRA